MIRRLVAWARRLVGGRAPRPKPPKPKPTYHLLMPGTLRGFCGARMAPLEILTIEVHVVTCKECRWFGLNHRLRGATSIR